jgi:CDP-diacylglycerol--serine O-phosphatidyltransferase
MSDSTSSQSPKKGIYFLPSLFTTAGLFFGFYAIIQATQGRFEQAAIGVLIAMITDGLDGRVARWTNTASDFGKEYDSLVDLIAFGLAPGLIMYFWSLQYLGKAGWLVGFLYTAATALRLARFNTLVVKENRYFFGLACPAAAAFVVFWVWNFHVSGVSPESIAVASALVMMLMALFMVSNIKFRSFKDFDPKHKISFFVLLAIVASIVLISFDPPRVLFLLALVYAASGPVGFVLRRRKGHEESPAFLPDEDDELGDESSIEDGTDSTSSDTSAKVQSIDSSRN